MGAPNTHDDELVSAILAESEFRGKAPSSLDSHIRAWIAALRTHGADAPAFGYSADNEKRAKRLLEWIEEGKALFAAMPRGFRLLLFHAGMAELYDLDNRKAAARLRRFMSL